MAKKTLAAAEKASSLPARGYPDLHDHLEQLEREGLLIRINEPVDKDQEMHPLVRWQFRGLEEAERFGFLFDRVTGIHGENYRGSVAASVIALCIRLTSFRTRDIRTPVGCRR